MFLPPPPPPQDLVTWTMTVPNAKNPCYQDGAIYAPSSPSLNGCTLRLIQMINPDLMVDCSIKEVNKANTLLSCAYVKPF